MSGYVRDLVDVVATADEARTLEREPLIVLDTLTAFLDDAALGSGAVSAVPIGAGHSNVTYALTRGADRYVLRRPPRGPLPVSAHDMLREARLLIALGAVGVRVPDVLATCEDPSVIGAPFYVMPFLDGHVLGTRPLRCPTGRSAPAAIGAELVDALIELHSVDVQNARLEEFGRSGGYLQRQLRRFAGLLAQYRARSIPELELTADWLRANLPPSAETTVVHGDYRLGNVMFAATGSPRISAVLDWELATLGDPLADVGYMTAMWAQPDDPRDPMLDLCDVTREPGFPDRRSLAERYARLTGRDLAELTWYQTLALWKAAIFLEGSYQRHLVGSTDDPYFAELQAGVPILARRALGLTRSG